MPAEFVDALAWSIIALTVAGVSVAAYVKNRKLLWRALALFAVFVSGTLFVVSCHASLMAVAAMNGVRP